MGTFEMNRFSPTPPGVVAHGTSAPSCGDETESSAAVVLAGGRYTDSAHAWESAWIDLGGEG